jgi:hypothetical protein
MGVPYKRLGFLTVVLHPPSAICRPSASQAFPFAQLPMLVPPASVLSPFIATFQWYTFGCPFLRRACGVLSVCLLRLVILRFSYSCESFENLNCFNISMRCVDNPSLAALVLVSMSLRSVVPEKLGVLRQCKNAIT